MIEGIVLDLDDTLYLERDFVRSGFRKVAEFVERVGVTDEHVAFAHLWEGFESGRRGDAFDSLHARFPLGGRTSVPELVEIYRSHRPDIQILEPEALSGLARSGLPLAMISDGDLGTQSAKIDALGLRGLFSVVVLTGEWGHDFWKPHPRAFELVEAELGLPGKHLAYVADNPRKDFIAPNRRGWLSVRLRMPGQLHHDVDAVDDSAAPSLEVSSLHSVNDVISVDSPEEISR